MRIVSLRRDIYGGWFREIFRILSNLFDLFFVLDRLLNNVYKNFDDNLL